MNRDDTAAAEARRAYMRQWRRNNPDKVRAQQERYWAKKGEEITRQMALTSGEEDQPCHAQT